MDQVPLTLGVEEEYQIIHPETRDLHSYVQELLERSRIVLPEGQLKPEFMQSQVEVGSHVCRNIQEVRHEVVRLRRAVCQLAAEDGMCIAAASTHPFANWVSQDINAGERYRKLLDQMQGVAQQLLIFGMHVHIGFGEGNRDLMIEIMNQLRYFLPHILALSTSSPFWQGRPTGLKSYRSVIFEMLPRTGIPQSFRSYSEYQSFVDLLGRAGSISEQDESRKVDATKIWWDVRPHPQFDTLEVRIADMGTRVDETVCIVALVQAVVNMLLRLRLENRSWRHYRRHHITENKWRAMRYGIHGKLIDFGRAEEVPMDFLALELLDLIAESAHELGSTEEINYVRTILREGTSADRQLHTYAQALDVAGAAEDPSEDARRVALHAVVDQLVRETVEGVPDVQLPDNMVPLTEV
ncbi:MAG: carboxylate-amine ligase [Anaerolineales bacterium]